MEQKKLNLVQEADLKLAKKLKNICEQNGINYIMLGGAMLGAVRHKGFIPWDDDLDFGLLRSDYEKLYKYLAGDKSPLSVASYKNETTHDYPFKVVDPNVTLVNRNHKVEEEQSAWIDVFPIDGMPNNLLLRRVHQLRLLKDRAFLKLSQLSTGVALSNPNRSFIEKSIIKTGTMLKIDRILNEKKMMMTLDRHLKKYSPSKSAFLVNFMGAYKFQEMFEKNIYLTRKNYSFEDTSFSGVQNYDVYLKQLYGDYMKLPKVVDRDKHKMELKE
ncbi:LicD family protein [Pediococcus pentosaceus]|uniref:LicD family protein n=1 Tax=Pediococcus pentosaceus TaxID=1255 RepID=UPI003F206922